MNITIRDYNIQLLIDGTATNQNQMPRFFIKSVQYKLSWFLWNKFIPNYIINVVQKCIYKIHTDKMLFGHKPKDIQTYKNLPSAVQHHIRS